MFRILRRFCVFSIFSSILSALLSTVSPIQWQYDESVIIIVASIYRLHYNGQLLESACIMAPHTCIYITLPGWEFYNCSVQILTPSFARHQEILTILVLYHVLLLKLTPESLLQFTCSYRWSFRAFAFPMALTQKSVEIFPQRFSISNQIFIFPSLIIFPFFFTKNLLILCWKSWVFFN